jgi:hypothetical protein
MNEIELIGQRKGKQLIIICLKIIKQVSINYRCVYKHYKRGGIFGGCVSRLEGREAVAKP